MPVCGLGVRCSWVLMSGRVAIYVSDWKLASRIVIEDAILEYGSFSVMPARIVLIEKYLFRNTIKEQDETEKIIKQNDIERQNRNTQINLYI